MVVTKKLDGILMDPILSKLVLNFVRFDIFLFFYPDFFLNFGENLEIATVADPKHNFGGRGIHNLYFY